MGNEIAKHTRKIRSSAFEYILAYVNTCYHNPTWLKEHFALVLFIKICSIYNTYFSLDDNITTYILFFGQKTETHFQYRQYY